MRKLAPRLRKPAAATPSLARRTRGALRAACAVFGLLGASSLEAATPAGTVISAQTYAEYTAPGLPTRLRATSNLASVRVKGVQAGLLEPDISMTAAPSAPILLRHRLRNTGNVLSNYELRLVYESRTELLDALLIHDVNRNGRVDSADRVIDAALSLARGEEEEAHILIQGRTPAQADFLAEIRLRLEAKIVGAHQEVDAKDVGEVAPAYDVIAYARPNEAWLGKNFNAACSGVIPAGGEFTARIEVLEAGRLAAHARDFQIDGAAARGVMIEDPLAREVLPSLATPEISLAGVHALLGFGEGSATVWRSWPLWNGLERPTRIGFFFSESALTPGAQARMSYHLRTLSAGPLAALAGGPTSFDAEGDGIADLTAAAPCPTPQRDVCFAEAQAAFALPNLQNSPAEAALAEALRSLLHFTPEGAPVEGEARSGLIVYAPSATAAPGGELTASIFDETTGDSLVARLTAVPDKAGYFALVQPAQLGLDAVAGRGLLCGLTGASSADCRLQSSLRSSLRAEISAVGCSDSVTALALVDGGGLVFAADTNAPLSDALVAFEAQGAAAAPIAAAGGAFAAAARPSAAAAQPTASVRTDSEGRFRLPQALPIGEYCVTVTKEGYVFPSAELGREGGFTQAVDPVLASGCARGGLFRVEPTRLSLFGGGLVAGLDLPLDAGVPAGEDRGVWIEKSVSATSAQVGDFLRYEVKIENRTGRALSEVTLRDEAAAGLAYAPGSLRIDGAAPADEERSLVGRSVNVFELEPMDPGATRVVSYVMRVGAGASGDLINSASAAGDRPDGSRVGSAVSTARVRLEKTGPLSDRNYLIGRVSVASVCEAPPPHIAAYAVEDDGLGLLRLPREDGSTAVPKIWPVAGARVWLETGVYAVTDERGYYSVYGLQSGPHVVRLDGETTPRPLKPVSPRGVAETSAGWSQFVNLRFGDLARADFHLLADCAQLEAVWPKIAPESVDGATPRIEMQLDEAVRFESRVRDLESDLRARARGDGDYGRGLSGDLHARTTLGAQRTEAQSAENAQEQVSARPAMIKSEEAVKTLTADMGRDGQWLWPKDGISRDGRFMAAIRAGAEPELYVNGVLVPQSQLGERLHNPAARSELVAWYGVRLESGVNKLEIRGRDPFGNERLLASGEFRRPGAPTRLVLASDRLSLPADGRSQVVLTLKLTDAVGLPVEGVSFATLHAEDGLWMTQDLDGKARGLQLRLEDGEARAVLASAVRAGPVRVTAEDEDGRRAELDLRFSADDRPLMAVGLVAFEANFAGRGWHVPESLRVVDDEDDFSESYEMGARGAVFLKGKIRGDALLTLLYDSSRRAEDELFRDLDPNAYYPVYGDGSITGYEAQARSPLYVRLEKGGFMGMWGDFATDAETELKLGGLQRNLTGVNAVYQNEDWRVQGFAARPDASMRSMEIQGLGLAMGYQLPGAPLAGGSERIALIARDRLNPGITLSRTELRRGSDYALDYETGRLDFFSPVPSLDEDLNPIYISASYETQAAAESYTVAGVRIERRLTEDLRAGAAYNHVDDPAERNRLAAVYGEYRPSEDLRLRAEGAWSRNPDTGVAGTAVLVEGEAKLAGGYRLEGGFGRAETGFQSENASVSAGRMEARASFSGPVTALTDLRAQGVYSEDLANDNWRASAEAELRRPIGPVEASAGLRYEEAETGGDRTRQTFAVGGIRGGAEILGREVSGALEVAKAIDTPAFRANARLDLQATPDTNIYVKHEFANDDATVTGPEGDGYLSVADAFSQGRTVFGVENSWLPDTRVYSETRLTGGAEEREAENVLGLRGEYKLRDGLTLQAQAEHTRAISGASAESTAVSLGLRDERRPGQSRAFRLEGREQEGDWTFGATAAIVGRATEELTLLAAARYDGRLPETGFANHQAHLRLGLAFRPTNNRIHGLAYYEAEYEKLGREDALNHILSAHVNAQLTDRLQFSGRVGLRFVDQRFDGLRFRSEVGLADIRVLYGLTERLAIEARAGGLTLGWGQSSNWSGGLGINYGVTDNVELGLGYNFSGFEESKLDPQGYNREGVYMRINVKFDEDLFNWLSAR